MIEINEIPEKIHNITISEENRKRLSMGFPTGIIKDIVFEDGQVLDAKLVAVKNEKGNIEIGYEEKEESLRMPNKIFDKILTDAQKNLLFDGNSLGGLIYKGNEFFIHVDPELNKVVIRSADQINIPKRVGGYQLDAIDKNNLANNKTTDNRVFQAPDGTYFTAKLGYTLDKKGIEFINVKQISDVNAPSLIEKLNASKVITDESRMLNMVGIPVKSEQSEIKVESPLTLETTIKVVKDANATKSIEKGASSPKVEIKPINELSKSSAKSNSNMTPTRSYNSHVAYDSVYKTDKGFNIDVKKTWIPSKIKGVTLTKEQKDLLRDQKPVLVKGMNLKSGKTDGIVMIEKNGGIKFDLESFTKSKYSNKSKNIEISK